MKRTHSQVEGTDLANMGALFTQLEAELRATRQNTVVVVDSASTSSRQQIQGLLQKVGGCIVKLPANSTDDIREQVMKLVKETFPSVPADVDDVPRFWRDTPLSETGMMLKSFGGPQPLPIHKDAQRHFTFEQMVFQRNPLAAQASLLPWKDDQLGEIMRAIVPERVTRMHVGGDTPKIMPGQAATPLHHDASEGDRTQIVLDAGTGPFRLAIVLLTEKARSLLYKICGTGSTQAKTRGFTRTPEKVRNLLLNNAVKGIGGPHLFVFKSTTLHCEVPSESPGSLKKFLRVYCGFKPLPAEVSRTQLVNLAWLREEHGYALSAFARSKKANGKNPLFVNDKSTQYHALKVVDKDARLVGLFEQLKKGVEYAGGEWGYLHGLQKMPGTGEEEE
jgi:hypothetical protein